MNVNYVHHLDGDDVFNEEAEMGDLVPPIPRRSNRSSRASKHKKKKRTSRRSTGGCNNNICAHIICIPPMWLKV